MRAAVVHAPGGADALHIEEIPLPGLHPGWVRIRVRAFALSRSELYARRGDYPEVNFPRVLGTECVGVVDAAAHDALFRAGQTVATVMGGMGRLFDGSYAECVLAPVEHVMPIATSLPWEQFAAIPKSFLTAQQALETLDLAPGQTLVIRGATSTVGMAALSLAKDLGATVLATTRNPAKIEPLRAAGADAAIVDTGAIADEVQRIVPGGANALLELVGSATLRDSLLAMAPKGIVCYMGALGENNTLDQFQPLAEIPSGVRLTTYASRGSINAANCAAPLQRIVDGVAADRLRPTLDRVFPFDEIAAAHRHMEASRALGTIVVTVP